ncbi:MAG: SPOR domain-containing protein [Acidobacteria bacterium]|nr:SPOR domain-containing protein [Acidobacteriota bacterium]
MAEESRSQIREFELQTRHLAAIVVLMALLCISSFLLGRWVERQATRATEIGSPRTGESGTVPVEDVNRELTYFRTLEEDHAAPKIEAAAPPEKQLPVRVESKRDPAAASAEAPAAGPPATHAGLLIQVMATKDPRAAEALRVRLAAKGYPVSITAGDAPAEAGMRKVKVGPYAGRAEAERIARRLQSEERLRTWIP